LILRQKYYNEAWFKPAQNYWSNRFTIIEGRFFEATRFVEIHTDNRSTFSYEFASILRDCGSAFGSVMDMFVKETKAVKPGTDTNISDYRKFLCELIKDISKRSLQIRPLFPKGLVLPFEDMKSDSDSPKWWDAYNKVKHNEYIDFRSGNLENCVNALSSLALLGNFSGWLISDQFFVNVGIPYTEDSVQKKLFP
jgi:hypothetical protein